MDGVTTNLGSYVSEEVAARVADRAAIELGGEFAYLNFPNDVMEDDVLDGLIALDNDFRAALIGGSK